ncbi:MarR family winged helix-turn-helix transcriptional regulator [Yinghuangia soli]|uniref:MarR family transcriptional regulator n=1 Tax=Yinghuangia soli TaxID=2908204 RepID=A0AA41U9F2_9ACTN|nr:MarR family transcriptional regulator [Yinghuangia soli]MCF2533804.1 MarR family transcriptional regulator [Yinghuangia soli]
MTTDTTTAGTSAAAPTGEAAAATVDPAKWDALITLHARVEHDLERALKRTHNLGLSEYRALCHLSTAHDGELRMQELAARLGLNQSSVSRLVARLEADDLTRRDLCPADRRGVYTVITDAGRTRQSEAAPTYTSTLTESLNTATHTADPTLAPLLTVLLAP